MNSQGNASSTLLDRVWDRQAFRLWEGQSFLTDGERQKEQAAHRLAQALDAIVREELSPSQRQVLERCWFDGAKAAQVAREMGCNRSTVTRTLRRAQEQIYDRLKYAVFALREEDGPQDCAGAVAQAAQSLAVSRLPEETVGQRVQKLRMRRAMSRKQLADALSTEESAVSRWERDVALPDTQAVIGLARLFGVRTDEILFGGGAFSRPPAQPGAPGPARPRK